MWNTPETTWSHTVTSMDTARNSAWQILSYLSHGNGTGESLAMGSKRSVQDGTPGTLALLGQGLAGALRVTREVATGAAWRNATGMYGGAQTVVAWSQKPTRSQYYRINMNGPVKVAGRPTFWGQRATAAMAHESQAYATLRARMKATAATMTYTTSDVARDPAERARRLQTVREALQSVWVNSQHGGHGYMAATSNGAVLAQFNPFNVTSVELTFMARLILLYRCLINNTVLCESCFIVGMHILSSFISSSRFRSAIRRVRMVLRRSFSHALS